MGRLLGAFGTGRAPLLSQPVVRQNTQALRMSNNLCSWEHTDVVAAAVSYVEQQAPLFDAGFLEGISDGLRAMAAQQLRCV